MSLVVQPESVAGGRIARWSDVRGSLRENSPLILFAIVHGLVPLAVASIFSIQSRPYGQLWMAYAGFFTTVGLSLFAAFALWYLYHARIRKVPNFQSVAWHRIRNDFLRRDRLTLALPIIALWPITLTAFSYLKSVMPLIQPFYLDPALHLWDRALHFGIEPWRLLHPFLGYTWITYAINLIYALWFLAFLAVLILQACATGDRKLRMQYLLTQALAWSLIGNVAATLMSSAGPCYYGLVLGEADPYAPLMAYLHEIPQRLSFDLLGRDIQIPFATVILQDMLWQSQVNGDFGLAKGISAAPSMHVASTWIMWRLAWSMGRTARIFGSLFLAIIFIGSIHLGWHYALDGYLAIAGAWALWRLIGWLLDRPTVQTMLWPKGTPAPRAAAI